MYRLAQYKIHTFPFTIPCLIASHFRRCRNRSPGEANRAAITPAEIAAPDAPLDDFELKSPLAVVLRAITVWLPNGLAAIAYEEPKAGADIEAGVQDDVPRTPKDP